MPIRPEDESMHENTGEENFNESMYFNFYDRSRKLGGFFRIGNRPNERQAEVTIALYRPDGTALFNYKRPEIADNSAFDAGGMRFTVVEPFRRLRVTYEGKAVYLTRPLDLEDPRRAFTANPFQPVRVDLEYEGLSPIYGGVAGENEAANRDMVFAKGHYEQHLRIRGTLQMDRETHEIEALGLRDHSWGPRSWQSPKFYRWLNGQFDEDFGFMGSQIVMQNGRELLGGFVYRYGENHPVRGLELRTDRTKDGYQDRIALTLHTDRDEFAITGKVLGMLPLRNRREGRTTSIAEGLTFWRCGPHMGYGLAEYLDQV